MKKDFETLLKILNKWENIGSKTLINGTRLIGHVPHVAPEAWLHEIHPALDKLNIKNIEEKLNFKTPEHLKEFWSYANGINIFSDSLSIWGLKTSYVRSGDESIQPYDIIVSNEEKKERLPDKGLLFGSYSWDGSVMMFDLAKSTSKVYRCDRKFLKVIQEWDNLWVWIISEAERLSKLFDVKGVKYNKSTPTIPT